MALALTPMYGKIYGKIYDKIHGEIYGRIYGETYGKVHGEIYGEIYSEIYGKMYGEMYGKTYGEMYEKTYGEMYGQSEGGWGRRNGLWRWFWRPSSAAAAAVYPCPRGVVSTSLVCAEGFLDGIWRAARDPRPLR